RLQRSCVLMGPPATDTYMLSLHDALPIWIQGLRAAGVAIAGRAGEGYRLEAPLELLSTSAIRAAMTAEAAALLGHLDVAWSVASDRKSTRLNSSHVKRSYAVFCLKKKKRS